MVVVIPSNVFRRARLVAGTTNTSDQPHADVGAFTVFDRLERSRGLFAAGIWLLGQRAVGGVFSLEPATKDYLEGLAYQDLGSTHNDVLYSRQDEDVPYMEIFAKPFELAD